jgi:hypothetical protein
MQLVAVAEGRLGKGGAVLRKPKGDIFISKIKIKGDDITIIYELAPVDKERKVVTYVCKEQARNEFYKAIALIFTSVCELSAVDVDAWKDGSISDISIKETDEGVDVNISLLLERGQGAIALKCNQKDISYDLKGEIDNLLAETEDYISGKRAQSSLFDQ